MAAILRDLKYAVRLLRQSAVFTTFAILTLALGTAANVAIFSIVNGVLLKPLAFPAPDRLFAVVEIIPKIAHLYPILPVNPRHADHWKNSVPGIERLGLAQPQNVVLGGAGQAMRVPAAVVTPDLLATLGVRPLIGRLIQPYDAQAGHDQVVLLSYGLWHGQFGGDPNIVGQQVRIEGVPCQIIGVMPQSFHFPNIGFLGGLEDDPELFRPLVLRLSEHSLNGDFNYLAVARLKPGVQQQTALAMLNTELAAFAKTFPEKMDLQADLIPFGSFLVQDSRRSLLVLLGAVGVVLLIVCLNLATLLLARGTVRNRDVAVRAALGASRWRLLRESLSEALVLSVSGGIGGICLASAGMKWILAAAPASLPRRNDVAMDGNVLLFALGLVLVTALVFGLYPAWKQARRNPQEALTASSRSSTGSKAGVHGRSILIAIEVGFSTVLLTIGGLLLNSFVRLMNVNIGFRAENGVSAQLSLPGAAYNGRGKASVFYDKLLDALSQKPGITQAGVTSQMPLDGETWIDEMSRPGDTRPGLEKPLTNLRFVSGSYFGAMRIPILEGRAFAPADRSKKDVAIIGSTVARKLWPKENAVGQTLLLDDRPLRIIGVVGDTRADISKTPVSVVFVPYWQEQPSAPRNLTVVVRSTMDTHDAVTVLRRTLAAIDSGVPISHVRTLGEVVSDAVAQRRFQMLLVGIFAVCALLVAALGIFGVIAGIVAARRPEIGIRMALGATTTGVVQMILRQGMLPVVAGIVSGIVLTLGFGSAIRSLLYEVRPGDPLTYCAVAALLTGVAMLACWLPARRAAKVDPMEALRYE